MPGELSAQQTERLLFVSQALLHKEGGQEHKHIRLDQTIEQVKIQAEHCGDEHRHHELDQLHDDERAQHIAEQSHTQAGGPDGDLQDIHGRHDRRRSRQTLEEAFPAARVDAGVFDEHDAHQGQSCGDVQILRGRLDAEHTNEVGARDIQRHAHQIRHIPFAVLTQQPDEEIVEKSHDRFQDGLAPGDVIDPQIPRQQDRTEHQETP